MLCGERHPTNVTPSIHAMRSRATRMPSQHRLTIMNRVVIMSIVVLSTISLLYFWELQYRPTWDSNDIDTPVTTAITATSTTTASSEDDKGCEKMMEVNTALNTEDHLAALKSLEEDKKHALAEQAEAPPAKDRAQWEEQRPVREEQLHRVLSQYLTDTTTISGGHLHYRSKRDIVPAAARLDAIFQLTVVFDQLAKACDAEYWIDYGTLLGCHRNGFILPWDKDSDVSITEEARDKLRHCVNPVEEGGRGVTLRYPFVLEGRFDRDYIIPGRIYHHPTGTYMDIFVWYEYPRNRTEQPTEVDKQFLWHQWAAPRRKDMLFPFSKIECRNIAAGAMDRWYSTKGVSAVMTPEEYDMVNLSEMLLPHDLATLPSYTFPAPGSITTLLHHRFMDLRPSKGHVQKFGNGIYGNMDPFDESHNDCERIPCHPTDVRSCTGRTCCCHPPYQKDTSFQL